jgi:hypothetical protein
MATGIAVCVDGESRPYTVTGDIATVQVRGRSIQGKVTVEDGVTKFRVLAQHHGAHLMWYPARAD